MLRAILNKSWRQHPTRHQLYSHLPPITKSIQVRRTRHAGHCWRSRDKLISDVLLWTPTHGGQKQDGRHEHTFSNYVWIRDVVRKTCLRRWTIGKSGERGSGISVLPARHDDDEPIWKLYFENKEILWREDRVVSKMLLEDAVLKSHRSKRKWAFGCFVRGGIHFFRLCASKIRFVKRHLGWSKEYRQMRK